MHPSHPRLPCCERAVTLHALPSDIKASNILIDEEGQVRIADFGVAGWLDEITRRDAKRDVRDARCARLLPACVLACLCVCLSVCLFVCLLCSVRCVLHGLTGVTCCDRCRRSWARLAGWLPR